MQGPIKLLLQEITTSLRFDGKGNTMVLIIRLHFFQKLTFFVTDKNAKNAYEH